MFGIFQKSIWLLLPFVVFVCGQESCGISDCKTHGGELIAATVICRHGERNIIQPYPTDKWRSLENWPGGFGQLTNAGKQGHFILGEYLRQRYASIIRNDRFPGEIAKVKSTDVDRVLMSAGACLAALFPPTREQIWLDDFDWQPIAIHTTPTSEDYLMASSKPCDYFDYVTLEFMNKSDYKNLFVEYEPLIKFLETNSGADLSSLLKLSILRDTLFVEKSVGKCLPEWAETAIDPDGDLEKLTAYWYQIQTATKEMQKIKCGYLLKEILDQFVDKFDSKLPADLRLFMYFAHDVTIANMLHSLGFFEPPFAPSFSACMFFDLYMENDIPYVQVFYKPSPEVDTQILNIPSCGFNCTLDDMYSLYEDILPTQDFDDECKLRDGEVLTSSNPESYASLV